jgi:hypothetical protein
MMNSKLKTPVIAILVLPLIGLFYDGLNGFYVLRYSKSISGLIIGLYLTALFLFLSEALSNWVGSKDDFSHPLYKRLFHLLLLLFSGAIVLVLFWLLLSYFGVAKV